MLVLVCKVGSMAHNAEENIINETNYMCMLFYTFDLNY